MQEVFITKDSSPTLLSHDFGIHYHSVNGALTETQIVFINAGLMFQIENGLKEIRILEYGFGTGLNIIETICAVSDIDVTIHIHTIEAFPVHLDIIESYITALNVSEKQKKILLQLHQCPWGDEIQIADNVRFTKYHTNFEVFESALLFDLIYFDCFAPESQPQFWEVPFLTKVHAIMQNNGVLTTYCAKGSFKRNLKDVGFKIQALPGPPGKREMTRAEKLI